MLTGLAFWAGGIACWTLQQRRWSSGTSFFALVGYGNLNYALAVTAFPFILLWYLNRESVKKAFGIVEA